MADVHKLPEVSNLSKIEVYFILTSFVEYEGNIELVKEKFDKAFNRSIKLSVIKQLTSKYQDRMKDWTAKAEQELLKEPLASRKNRLRLLYLVIKESLEKKERGSFKIGKDDYAIRRGQDNEVIIKAVAAAEKIMYNAERLRIDRAKLTGEKLDEDGPVRVDDGREDSDEEHAV